MPSISKRQLYNHNALKYLLGAMKGEYNASGSHDQAEEYKHLEPAEAKKRLGQLVDLMDKDEDGFVTEEELDGWVKKSFRQLDRDEATRQFEQANRDQNVGVSWEEYLDKMYGYTADEVKEFEKDTSDEMVNFVMLIHYDKKKFMVADLDKDNFLSLDEYDAFLHPSEHKHLNDVEMERVMEEHDKNKDGKVSFEEFMGDHKPEKEEDQIAEKENFKEHDKDGNGYLSRDEVQAWSLPTFDEAAIEEAKHLINESDKDKDGKLTKEEIVDAHEVFVGSQATDYGNHLDKLMREEL
ncbi:calumenin-A-like isoform X2 [Tubulanus polymorphus]|uniref:calumenin-A-like isoform X2 n=1 Tax=Tubulanus polymorphus TaxID=672921 RepID=UPI003DA4A6A8